MPDEHRTKVLERCGEQAIDATYPAFVEAIGAARVLVRGWLGNLAVDEVVVADVVLAVSEACTNAVLHGYRDRPIGTFRLVGDRIGPHVRIVVSDDGCGPSPRSDSPGLGVGLALMSTLSSSLELRSVPDGHGTVLTMTFDTVKPGSANGDRRDGHEDRRGPARGRSSRDGDQIAGGGDRAIGRVDTRPHADGHPRGQRERDIRTRKQTSAARATAAWLGDLAGHGARPGTAHTRDPLRPRTQPGEQRSGRPQSLMKPPAGEPNMEADVSRAVERQGRCAR
jgi:anti-sigma regulatory factor (Ser/Thr protein kinase)